MIIHNVKHHSFITLAVDGEVRGHLHFLFGLFPKERIPIPIE
jgi:hypothetical protein